jgi:hypothetical protein
MGLNELTAERQEHGICRRINPVEHGTAHWAGRLRQAGERRSHHWPELEELALTETQLLEQTAALLGVSLAQLVRAVALVYAKREFLNHKKYLSPSPAELWKQVIQRTSPSKLPGPPTPTQKIRRSPNSKGRLILL